MHIVQPIEWKWINNTGINHLGGWVLFAIERMKLQMNLHNYGFWSALTIDWSRKKGCAEVLCSPLFALSFSSWRKVAVSTVGGKKDMCSRLNPSIFHLPFLLIDSRMVKKWTRLLSQSVLPKVVSSVQVNATLRSGELRCGIELYLWSWWQQGR